MQKVNILLFDVSPFIYIAYYGTVYALKGPREETNEARIFPIASNMLISRIRSCFEMFDGLPILPIFCYDGSVAKKKNLVKNYKEGRTHSMSKDLRNNLLNIVKQFPGLHITNQEEEADDLFATMKEQYKDKDCNFFIFSKDNDLLQLCDYRTIFYDPALKGGIRDRKYLIDKFNGIKDFKKIILHKICFGDSSDNIEGIFKGQRRQKIVEAFVNCLTFNDFLKLDIVKQGNLEEQAKNLYNIIKLRKNLDFEQKIVKDDSFLETDSQLVFQFQ